MRSPRTVQGAAAGLVLAGFVVDVRLAVPLAAVALLATFVVVVAWGGFAACYVFAGRVLRSVLA